MDNLECEVKMKKVLVACEESQAVVKELRHIGIESFSCDIEPCSGGHPEWHLQTDVLPLLNDDWDMILAFPPCTHIATSGARHFAKKCADGRQQQGIDFFMEFTNLRCPKVAIENPVGIMSTIWRKPDQIIQPYQFGDSARKTTCIWLKGLPALIPTNIVDQGEVIKGGNKFPMPKWTYDTAGLPPKERSRARSKTFPGIAKAMAIQWGGILLKEELCQK